MKFSILFFMKLLGMLILSFQIISVNGQDLLFQHVNVDNGLSQNSVLSMMQDSDGFIWFGTEYGLNKYDGYKTEVFIPEEGSRGTITGSIVWAITEDSKARIWVGTNEGVHIFNKDSQSFRRLEAETEHGEQIEGVVCYILEADNGEIWFGTTAQGLYRFNEHENRLTHYPITNVDPQAPDLAFRIWSIYIDRNEILWAGTWNKGLIRLDTKDVKFDYLNTSNSALRNNYVGSLYEVSDSTVWVGTRDGMQVLNVLTNEITSSANKKLNNIPIIQDVHRDENGTFWIASYGEGLFLYDRDLNSLKHIFNDEKDPQSLSDNLVLNLMQDASGCVWAGTYTGGANKYCPDTVKFTCCQHKFDVKNIFAINGEDPYLLLGSYGNGFYLYDKAEEEVVRIKPDPSNISGDLIVTMAKGDDGAVWIGYQGSGFSRLNIHTQKIEEFFRYNPETAGGLTSGNIRRIITDNLGRVWLGTAGGGLNLYNPPDRSFRYFTTTSEPSINNNHVSAIFEDSRHNIWIGTLGGGLNKLDRSLQSVTEYKSIPGSAHTLSNDHVWDILEDRNGMIWVATNRGLNSLDPGTGKITRYTEQDGLGNNWVYTILEDNEGRLWLSTNKGISVFKPNENRFINYDVRDGLQSNEFNANAKYKSNDGRLYFGGINGFNAFYPEKITANTKEPNVVITDLKVINKPVPIGESESEYAIPMHISRLKELVLTHNEPVISLEFAALHYVNPQKNRYLYKLEGFDNDWIEAGTRNFVTYTNLDADNYRFRVRGANSDGIWSSKEAILTVTVLPPPWKTWWAYTLYGLILAGGIAIAFRAFLARERLKADLKIEKLELQKAQELDAMKTRFFTGISHEFRTPLTLISAPVKSLKKKYGKDSDAAYNLRLVEHNSNKLLKLVNQLMELSKLEAGKLSLQVSKDDINTWLNIIGASFQSMAESRDIAFTRKIPDKPCIMYFDKDKVEQIVVNLLSNAFKFTPAKGWVEFDVIVREGYLHIRVTDNGKGIPPEDLDRIFDRFYQASNSLNKRYSEGSGIGLALVKELSQLHHGEVLVNSKENESTTFTVILPTGDDAYAENEIVKTKSEEANKTEDLKPQQTRDKDQKSSISKKQYILIVEDNDELRDYICTSLSEFYSVNEAGNGKEGLEKALSIPDLIISDLMMPEMDGMEMLHELKSDPKTSHIPLIMLTAKADRESKLEGLNTGADQYLNKPFDMEELRVRVNSLLAQRERIKNHFYKEFISSPEVGNIRSADNLFLKKAMEVLEKHLGESSFTVDQFAKELAMSRTQLHRKLKAILGCAATEFIRQVRLKKAWHYLNEKKGTVSEIAYEVGFNNLSYFSKCFRETYGMNPSEFPSADKHA